MTAPATPQARRNRVIGGRKAADYVKRGRRNGLLGPDGSHRGSNPVDWDFGAVLARVKDAAERLRQSKGG